MNVGVAQANIGTTDRRKLFIMATVAAAVIGVANVAMASSAGAMSPQSAHDHGYVVANDDKEHSYATYDEGKNWQHDRSSDRAMKDTDCNGDTAYQARVSHYDKDWSHDDEKSSHDDWGNDTSQASATYHDDSWSHDTDASHNEWSHDQVDQAAAKDWSHDAEYAHADTSNDWMNGHESGDAQTADSTIAEIATDTPKLSTLTAAVTAAGLGDALNGETELTVFAPSNAAFEKLPEGTVETLVQPENKAALTNILTYHVVAGTYTSEDLKQMAKDGETLMTLQGQELTPVWRNHKLKLMDASGMMIGIRMADVEAKNGIVHVVGKVMMPKS